MPKNEDIKYNILDDALYFQEHYKWSIIPVGNNKRPLVEWKQYQTKKSTPEQLQKWFKQYPKAGIAVVTGKISNLIAIDIDPRNEGSNKKFKGIKTPTSRTGGHGWHYLFEYQAGIKTQVTSESGIEVKSDGAYIVLPPSLHPSGQRYKWLVSPKDVNLAMLPDFVKEWINKPQEAEQGEDKSNNFEGVERGKRNSTAASIIGKLLKRSPQSEWNTYVWQIVVDWNNKNKPPLPESELKNIFESIKSKESTAQSTKSNKDKRKTALELVDEIRREKIVFFHTPQKEGFASIKGDGRRIFKLRSRAFKQFVAHYFYTHSKAIISRDTMNNMIQVMEGGALFEGECYDLQVRITKQDDAIWYDLGGGSAVHIDKDGWRISDAPPILFRRYEHQLTQVTPERGGSADELLRFANVTDKGNKLLLLIFTVAAFIPGFPHPILVLYGPQGAGKTTPLKLLKSLIDPSVLKTLSAPDGTREFVQMASHHYFLFLDNLSYLQNWLSDSLARAVTGEGFTKRELFSDDDDIIYSFQRTMGLNGINLIVEKPDLLDRSILIELKRISKRQRREESEFWEEFEKVKPRLLGAIFTAVSKTLAIYPTISLKSYTRMADFNRWGCAIAKALGFNEQDFLDAYYTNINAQSEAAIEASLVGTAVVDFMLERDEWEGTASELLKALDKVAEELNINTKSRGWPKDPSWVTRRLQLITPNLLDMGVMVERDEKARPRRLILTSIDGDADDADIVSEPGEPSPDDTTSPTASTPLSGNQGKSNDKSFPY